MARLENNLIYNNQMVKHLDYYEGSMREAIARISDKYPNGDAEDL